VIVEPGIRYPNCCYVVDESSFTRTYANLLVAPNHLPTHLRKRAFRRLCEHFRCCRISLSTKGAALADDRLEPCDDSGRSTFQKTFILRRACVLVCSATNIQLDLLFGYGIRVGRIRKLARTEPGDGITASEASETAFARAGHNRDGNHKIWYMQTHTHVSQAFPFAKLNPKFPCALGLANDRIRNLGARNSARCLRPARLAFEGFLRCHGRA
jgi:hypothetical protein